MTLDKLHQALDIRTNMEQVYDLLDVLKNFKGAYKALETVDIVKREAVNSVREIPEELSERLIQVCHDYLREQEKEFNEL